MVIVYKNNLGELVSHTVVSTDPLILKGMNNEKADSDKCIDIIGVMYVTFRNWFGESVDGKNIVLAKKY